MSRQEPEEVVDFYKKLGEEFPFEKTKEGEIEFPFSKNILSIDVNPRKDVIVWMPPSRFLNLARRLTKPSEEIIEGYKRQIIDEEPLHNLALHVKPSKLTGKGIVIGHEGRHRATASQQLGIKQVPVVLKFRNENMYKSESSPDNPNVIAMKVSRLNDFVLKGDKFHQELLDLQKQIDTPPEYCTVSPFGEKIKCDLISENLREQFDKEKEFFI